jgi:hypothetical protein
MQTVIEEDSAAVPLILLAVMFGVLLGAGLGLAYMGGLFTTKKVADADHKRVPPQTALIVPAR